MHLINGVTLGPEFLLLISEDNLANLDDQGSAKAFEHSRFVYFTVTDFAKFLGLSGSSPHSRAI